MPDVQALDKRLGEVLSQEDAIFSKLRLRLGRVEINDHNDELQRLYFCIPDFCDFLSDEAKHKLLWGVDRVTPIYSLIGVKGCE